MILFLKVALPNNYVFLCGFFMEDKKEQVGTGSVLLGVSNSLLAVAGIALVVGILVGWQATALFTVPALQSQQTACEVEAVESNVVASKVLDYINSNALLPTGVVGKDPVAEKYNDTLYKVKFMASDGTTDQEFEVFATVDGISMFIRTENFNLFDLDSELPEAEPEPETEPEQEEYSEEDKQKLSEFVGCLEEKNFMIYGATWCGWTMTLVDSLGGQEIAEPIFVDCSVEVELCNSTEGIGGYPTMMINGEVYGGNLESRALSAIAVAAGCEEPVLGVALSEETGSGSC